MNDTEKHHIGTSFIGKVRSSLVLKLNLQMLGMLLSAFMAVNILINILYFGVIFWKAEEGAQNFMDTFGIPQNVVEEKYAAAGGYEIRKVEESLKGLILPELLQEQLPLEALDAKRNITAPGFDSDITLMEHIGQVAYHMIVTVDGVPYQVTYALGTDLRLYVFLLLGLLAVELLYLLGSIGKNTMVIRKTLKPLSEMAETARTLHEGVASMGSAADGSGIKYLAGAISTIDVRQLDRRISIESSQNELKDLAHAINDMLNRINQSYQSQVRFVSDASHELRTPISVIQGYAGLLDRWGKFDEKTMQESIDAIKSETENMKVLVEQLLFLARGDNDTMQLHLEVFELGDMIEEIIRETRLIDSAHIFETQLTRPVYLEADQQLIKQAIRILVDNSMKYTPSGEKIVIKTLSEEGWVKIQVQDNGIGIAPEDVSHIFDRFYRSDESRARKTGGSGLGLSIAKWIIQRHEGQFEVLSRVDIGTRTTVVLPEWKGD
ncbi:sensor histidine kinase [Candidatus Contubernalis alkaliaceticus]|uniref:sensor histidine kinase n=1 Tax=Candidatus Contubernalis alkaliaceticus TaxID=338645 RepID=UPI001F4C47B7|nr:HAMP domain-containing sensor histidine kinase [Candidatus Contubernalis alkalaceticus]UNC91031.1 HAMP domain-containing histidine kinase [Candidatus Contubernalis alkalaceticus]